MDKTYMVVYVFLIYIYMVYIISIYENILFIHNDNFLNCYGL